MLICNILALNLSKSTSFVALEYLFDFLVGFCQTVFTSSSQTRTPVLTASSYLISCFIIVFFIGRVGLVGVVGLVGRVSNHSLFITTDFKIPFSNLVSISSPSDKSAGLRTDLPLCNVILYPRLSNNLGSNASMR